MGKSRRLLAVGDIHGCLDRLETLVEKIKPSEDDYMVFLGDYINRGPDSKGVVDYLLGLKSKVQCIFLLGNHEKMMLEYVESNDSKFLVNGGYKTIESYNCNDMLKLPNDHMDFYNSLLPYYETESHIFVHAGLKPGINLKNQDIKDLLWIRDEFLYSDYDWGKTIVYGHTVNRLPVITKNRIGIDTGCVYPRSEGYGCLTCCDVVSKVMYSI